MTLIQDLDLELSLILDDFNSRQKEREMILKHNTELLINRICDDIDMIDESLGKIGDEWK